jgi:hypothetical protein
MVRWQFRRCPPTDHANDGSHDDGPQRHRDTENSRCDRGLLLCCRSSRAAHATCRVAAAGAAHRNRALLGALPPARRVGADSMRHVSGGTKRPSYFATTRTHGGNSPRNARDARFPASPDVVLAQAAAPRHVPCARAIRQRSRARGCRLAAAVRSTPLRRTAGSGAQRFGDASSCRVIRAACTSTGGVGHAGCRWNPALTRVWSGRV